MVKRLAEDPSKERAHQQREYQKARRERDEAVNDVYTVFDIRMIGRERIEGHDTIAFSLTPWLHRRGTIPKNPNDPSGVLSAFSRATKALGTPPELYSPTRTVLPFLTFAACGYSSGLPAKEGF